MSKNNPQTPEEKQEKFLVELAKLTQKYGISIGGCGCCGSPWLAQTEKKGHYVCHGGDRLSYVEQSDGTV